ncbi:hypothetical protein LX32DRAFT_692905 [Colletotrichum zoysiae]|uniref:Uncharacterized protein n=1 Tax=Colletotrichum zoysiae TaxID=1216348 RepID=A0AAD9HL75_9PEZI|nr:hypothetical protein LX32DRAFT_692905 [Colletotrichum zoysiae]
MDLQPDGMDSQPDSMDFHFGSQPDRLAEPSAEQISAGVKAFDSMSEDDLVSRITSLDSKLDNRLVSIDTKLDNLVAKVGCLDAKSDNLEAKLDNFETKLDNVYKQAEYLHGNVVKLNAKFLKADKEQRKYEMNKVKTSLADGFSFIKDTISDGLFRGNGLWLACLVVVVGVVAAIVFI